MLEEEVKFTNQGGKVAVQAGTFKNDGTITFNQFGYDPLDRLFYTPQAIFNHYDRQNDPTCLPGTRVDILHEIYNWLDNQDEQHIFWLNGWAGTGKSTIARTVAHEYHRREELAATYFFSDDRDVQNARIFVTTIAWQLASVSQSVKNCIYKVLEEHSDIATKSLEEQWRQLVMGPLSAIDAGECQRPYVIVIDGLDQCEDNEIRIILRLLTETRLQHLRFLIASRPTIHFPRNSIYRNIVLHNIEPDIVNYDIDSFIRHRLMEIQQEHYLNPSWPGEENIDRLVQKASGLFIWAATACKFISESAYHADSRLATLLQDDSSGSVPDKQLDKIYLTVLRSSVSPRLSDEERGISYSLIRYILGSIAVSFSQPSLASLYKLLGIERNTIRAILNPLQAMLDIPVNDNFAIRLHHPSICHFLLDPTRCTEEDFLVDKNSAHRLLWINCIRIMSTHLKQDICDLGVPAFLRNDVSKYRVQQSLSSEVQYACLYWVKHLQESGYQIHDSDIVHQLFKDHVLHWLEALSWMGKIHDGLGAIIELNSIISVTQCPEFFEFIEHIKEFVEENLAVIERTPLQIYLKAFVFFNEKDSC